MTNQPTDRQRETDRNANGTVFYRLVRGLGQFHSSLRLYFARNVAVYALCFVFFPLTINETVKWFSSLSS